MLINFLIVYIKRNAVNKVQGFGLTAGLTGACDETHQSLVHNEVRSLDGV